MNGYVKKKLVQGYMASSYHLIFDHLELIYIVLLREL